MATYTTDLTVIADMDSSGGTAVEPGSVWTSGRSPIEDDTDFPIQGTVHGSLTFNSTGKGGLLIPGNSWTHTSGDYIFGWLIWLAPSTIATQASGGLVMLLGSAAGTWDAHYVGGSDYGSYPYGGWQNFVVDPERSPDENSGTPTAYHYVGAGANCIQKVNKGNPLGCDVFRYGRGELRVVGTSATFTGMAGANDANTARWGLFQAIEGGYKFKGLMYLGYGGSTTFSDSDVNIVIDNTEMVATDFNRIEIHNTGSSITWTNISFSSLGTNSKGQLEMIDDCTFTDTGGVFTDMDTFIYKASADITGRTFRGCGQITQGSGSFTDCLVDKSTAAVAMVVNLLSNIDSCTFVSDGTGHAVDLGTIGSTQALTWSNITTGYASSNGSTGNEAIKVNVATGITLTINVTSGDSPKYYNTAGSPGTIIIQAPVVITFTGIPTGTNARVYLGTPNSSTTATLEASEDNITDGTFVVNTNSGGSTAYVVFVALDYEYKLIEFAALPSTNQSIPVSFGPDRTYNT